MKKIEFICSLSSKKGVIGGETLKNDYIFNYLNKNNIKFNLLDFERYKHIKIILILKCIWSIINPFSKSILISKASKSSYSYFRLASIFNIFNKDIYYMVIGGIFHQFLKDGVFNIKYYKNIKYIYVESLKMKEELEKLGLNNIEYLPNFKEFKMREYKEKEMEKPLKCVFFSRIVPQKGVNMIFDALRKVNKDKKNLNVDFYGPIEKNYNDEFNKKLSLETNAEYKGVLNVQDENTFEILSNYNLMLFPTYWEGEGFPGTLIDSFISGIPVLASDWNYNSEILSDKTGFLFEAKNQEEFVKILKDILRDLDGLTNKRKKCLEEAKKYHVDNVLKNVIEEIKR